ncbi:MAG: hypothetical protein V7L23_32280 [Nostoc sp.]|uniref:hypothetical protein n=1 Tax=Nostoc sp. TaxID=1180 RepID=UPI002FF1B682
MIEQRIKEANGRLKNNYCGLRIEQIGGRLYLRGTLPPKPLSGKNKPYRQRISAANSNQDGVKIAERLAKKISVQIEITVTTAENRASCQLINRFKIFITKLVVTPGDGFTE